MPPITWAIEDPCSPSSAVACLSAAILAMDGGLQRMDKLAGKLGTRFEEVGLS
jgi:hypothetical protein